MLTWLVMGGEEYLVLGNKCLKFVEELNKKKDLSLVFRRFINSDSFFIIEPADRCNSHWLFDLEKKDDIILYLQS